MAGNDTSELFARMRESYARVGELGLEGFKSEYWDKLLLEGRQDYGGKGNFIEDDAVWADFRSNVITKGLDNANIPVEARPKAEAKIRALYERLVPSIPARFQPYLEESPIGNPYAVEIDGRRVTQSSIEYTYMLSHLDPYLADTRTVIDIGGGYGGFARLMKLAHPELRLVLLDLPEVGAIQTYFLSTAFPERTVRGLRDLDDVESIDPAAVGADFLVLPGQLIERLPAESFDLAINTRSMMEMDLETVGFYIEHIQQRIAVGGAFFCVNRYRKKTRLKDYPFDDHWYVSLSSRWPELIDQNPHHELIAIRTRHPVTQGLREHVAGFPPYDGALDRLRARLGSALGGFETPGPRQ